MMRSPPASSSTTESVTSLPRLLVVDDEPAVLKLVKTMLTRANYEVVVASSGSEGLKRIDEEYFDCVITDAIMPIMSGYDLVRAIRKHPQHASIPVLMLTRKRHRQDVKKAVEVGVSDYVLKPIDEHLLLDKVELCLSKGSGKRHTYELTLSESQAEASIMVDCQVTAISETDLSLWSPIPLSDDVSFHLRCMLFEEIGISMPYLKWVKCDPIREDSDLHGYQSKFSFVGVPEADLKKIRFWLQKEAIRRRK